MPGELHVAGCVISSLEDRGTSWFGGVDCFPAFAEARFVVRDDGRLACRVHPDCKGLMLCRVIDGDGSTDVIEFDHLQWTPADDQMFVT